MSISRLATVMEGGLLNGNQTKESLKSWAKCFLQIAKEHAGQYPLMESQDFGKLAYQSEFGPEHLISDTQRAETSLPDEWNALPEGSVPQFPEPVSESLCRFPLSICSSIDEIELLVKMFV